MSSMYENFHLCPDLVSGQRCFLARIYKEGLFETAFHEHVPAYRISEEHAAEVLRSLVARYSEWPGVYILRSMLNKRGRDPERHGGLIHRLTYPEPGVVRRYVSESHAHAWYDTVISKEEFRLQSSPGERAHNA